MTIPKLRDEVGATHFAWIHAREFDREEAGFLRELCGGASRTRAPPFPKRAPSSYGRYEQRAWVAEGTPGGWECDHLLSAMETPQARVWRFLI